MSTIREFLFCRRTVATAACGVPLASGIPPFETFGLITFGVPFKHFERGYKPRPATVATDNKKGGTTRVAFYFLFFSSYP
jgi:hypothetical protein